MEPVVLIIIGIVLIIIALVGSVLPGLPGPPIAYGALLLLLLNDTYRAVMSESSYLWLIVVGIITVIVTLLDYYLPIWGTKKYGGTKAGVKGSTIGLIVGAILAFFTFAASIIIGPLVGAYLAEKNAGQSNEVAWQSAKGTFIGFITGTLMKIVIIIAIAIYFTRIVI